MQYFIFFVLFKRSILWLTSTTEKIERHVKSGLDELYENENLDHEKRWTNFFDVH